MRQQRQRRAQLARAADGEADYLASVSDLMSGLLFVFIIALMVFALSLAHQEATKEREVEKLRGADDAREKLLEALQSRLRLEGVEVEIEPDQGVLRLKEGILFDSGSADLGSSGRLVVASLAKTLDDVLPCYTRGQQDSTRENCPAKADAGLLNALLIEGHTDDRPLTGASRYLDNWELSTSRARTVYLNLVTLRSGLDAMRNADGQSVLSVSGYADRRGVIPNTSDDARRRNRRIDLRFILTPRRDDLPLPAKHVQEALTNKPG